MKTKRNWKSGSRLDTVMNVLLIVLALGVLGVSAFEVEVDAGRMASNSEMQA